MRTIKECEMRIMELEQRIAQLETMLNKANVSTVVEAPIKATSSKSKDTETVGALDRDGKYVRTNGTFLSSKARYAIRMTAEAAGAKKLGKGNPVYEALVKTDKYVQVYEFKSVKDAKSFMDGQRNRTK